MRRAFPTEEVRWLHGSSRWLGPLRRERFVCQSEMPSAMPAVLNKCNLGYISLYQGRHFHRQRTSATFEVRLGKSGAGFVNLFFLLQCSYCFFLECHKKRPRNSLNFAVLLLSRSLLHDSVHEREQRLSDIGPIVAKSAEQSQFLKVVIGTRCHWTGWMVRMDVTVIQRPRRRQRKTLLIYVPEFEECCPF